MHYVLFFVTQSVIYLQFWAYGSWDLLFPISMIPTAEHYQALYQISESSQIEAEKSLTEKTSICIT